MLEHGGTYYCSPELLLFDNTFMGPEFWFLDVRESRERPNLYKRTVRGLPSPPSPPPPSPNQGGQRRLLTWYSSSRRDSSTACSTVRRRSIRPKVSTRDLSWVTTNSIPAGT